MGIQTEEALIRAAQGGHARAFEQVIGAHIPQVRRFARAFTHSDVEADDLAQDALVRVYRSLGGFRFQSSFSTWLFAVVRSAFLDARKSRPERERQAEQPLGPRQLAQAAGASDTTAEASLLERERRARLWDAIGDVPAEFRTVLVLFDVEGMTYEEIAAVERVALGTVKSRLSRGREHLRRLVTARRTPPSLPTVAGGGSPGVEDGNLARLSFIQPKEGGKTP